MSSEAMAEVRGGVSSGGEGGSEGSPYFPLPKFRAPYFNSDYIFVSIICVSITWSDLGFRTRPCMTWGLFFPVSLCQCLLRSPLLVHVLR